MKFLPIASLALVLALSGCSSEPEPTEAELKKARYERCKDTVKDLDDLFQIAKQEGFMDENDPRLVKLRDTYNLDNCNDWIWPELD